MARRYLPPAKISRSRHPQLVRTHFAEDARWNELCVMAVHPSPQDGFRANLNFVNHRAFAELTQDALLARIARSYVHPMLFVADATTFAIAELPVLVIDLLHMRGSSFRCIPSELWGVENNLSIANMDFDDFANAVQEDGVFRGFP